MNISRLAFRIPCACHQPQHEAFAITWASKITEILTFEIRLLVQAMYRLNDQSTGSPYTVWDGSSTKSNLKSYRHQKLLVPSLEEV